jgi:hypothetical protein
MRINEVKILRDRLITVVGTCESRGAILPSCVGDLKTFLSLVDHVDFEKVVGLDPDTPCWKYVLDGGFDPYPDLKDAYEEFVAEIKGFRP